MNLLKKIIIIIISWCVIEVRIICIYYNINLLLYFVDFYKRYVSFQNLIFNYLFFSSHLLFTRKAYDKYVMEQNMLYSLSV